jgi:hypothetical protein
MADGTVLLPVLLRNAAAELRRAGSPTARWPAGPASGGLV